MEAELKQFLKSLFLSVPPLRRRYHLRELLRRCPCCADDFSSFADAVAHMPPGTTIGFDHRQVVEVSRKYVDTMNPGDYPVFFWLGQILPDVKTVFELGGNTGQGFYVYRRFLSFPEELRWLSYDVPAAQEIGREIAQERNETLLEFTDLMERGAEADLYATFGTLQYIEEPFAEILGKLTSKPKHLLVSRVPFTEGVPYITMQNNGGWVAPYKIPNKAEFIKSIQALGYTMVAEWETRNSTHFLLRPELKPPVYGGFYFKKQQIDWLADFNPNSP